MFSQQIIVTCFSLCILLCLATTLQTVHSQNPNCSIEKDGLTIDLSKADNGTFGWIIQDYIPGSFYNVNPCKPVIPLNKTFCSFGGAQILYSDNYFHRCLGIGQGGQPKISLFDPKSIEHGLVVDFGLFSDASGQLLGAHVFVLCDENVEFQGHYIGKNKKFFKEEYVYEFKMVTKHACAVKKQYKNSIPMRG